MTKLLKFEAEVIRNEYITPSVFELDFKAIDVNFHFKAGQFVQITLDDPRTEGKNIKRSYSIASSPQKDYIRLCIKLVEDGLGTPQLEKLAIGDKIKVAGPFGRFTYKSSERKPFFISTGTGVAPFYSMLESLKETNNPPKKAIHLTGIRYENELLYDSYFKQYPNIEWIPAVSKPSQKWQGYTGRVTSYMLSLVDFPFHDYDYYMCGNGAMIKEIKALLLEKGVDKKHIFQEIYYT